LNVQKDNIIWFYLFILVRWFQKQASCILKV